ncbi:MAG: 50S ribosomal protein L10 [Clostridia bacterium]
MASEKILNQKKAEVKELAEKMKEAKVVLLTDYRGITVTDDNKIKKQI